MRGSFSSQSRLLYLRHLSAVMVGKVYSSFCILTPLMELSLSSLLGTLLASARTHQHFGKVYGSCCMLNHLMEHLLSRKG